VARDLDAALLESVRVRRRRLRDAFLHGALRTRRTTADNVRRLVIGLILAALACAICAGVSFVKAHIHEANTVPSVTIARVHTAPGRLL
jgi:hypothetical protein